jgi:RimJ/RimL family protein N-acetyltransferase
MERFWTSRMSAERLTPGHFEEIRRLHLHPQVMKTLSVDGQVLPDSVTRGGLRQAEEHWLRHGFGLWLFRDRADGRFLGRGGLKWYQIDGLEMVGLAYAVLFEHWNRGLATEMATACLDIGFGELGLPEIAAWTLPINAASHRVLVKLGFGREREVVFAGLPHRFFLLSADEWARQPRPIAAPPSHDAARTRLSF